MKHLLFLVLYLFIFSLGCELFWKEPHPGKIVHLAIGLNYQGTDVQTLRGTINDATELVGALNRLADSRGRVYCPLLLIQDGVETDFLPTKEGVRSQIHQVQTFLDKEDLFIISFAGHGHTDGSLVLYPPEGEPKILDWEDNPKPSVLLSPFELFEQLNTIQATTLLFLDSCYCGNFVQPSENSVSLIENDKGIEEAYHLYLEGNTRKNNHLYVLSATTADNTCKEPMHGEHIHGYFSQALLEGLGWDAQMHHFTNRKDVLSLDDLYHFIHENQNFPTSGMRKTRYQHPTINGGPLDLVLF